MKTWAVVLFDYVPQRDDELALRRETRLSVLDKSSDGWWKGEEEGTGKKGWFPSNYVREEETGNGVSAKFNGNGTAGGEPPHQQRQRGPSPQKRVSEVFPDFFKLKFTNFLSPSTFHTDCCVPLFI
jgi:NCK adaptor protein